MAFLYCEHLLISTNRNVLVQPEYISSQKYTIFKYKNPSFSKWCSFKLSENQYNINVEKLTMSGQSLRVRVRRLRCVSWALTEDSSTLFICLTKELFSKRLVRYTKNFGYGPSCTITIFIEIL